jgi:hypothetical protein
VSSCGAESAAEIDLAEAGLLRGGFELPGRDSGPQFPQVGDVVVEGARGDAEEFGDRGDPAAGVGQQVAGGFDDFLGGDGGASTGPAAGTDGGQALVGADDDEFADELREGGEDVEDESAAVSGGAEVLVQ